MPPAVGRFFAQLSDRNTWPRRLWYPSERYTTTDPQSEEWKKQSTELQSLIKTTLLTMVGFSGFCLLALATPDASILDAKSNVKMPLLNIDIDYTSFLYIGPMLIVALSFYIHILLAEWFRNLNPQTQVAGSADMYSMAPDIFNIQRHRMAAIIYNCLFYWIPIFVLLCFALKWIPQQRDGWGTLFSTVFSIIAIPVFLWIKIRRCPDRQRLRKNLVSWLVLGMTPLYLSLVFFAPSLTQDIRSGMKLYGVDLHRQDLTSIVLSGADLRMANLQEANLQEANLQGADLQGANLQGANLRGAKDARGANLQGANLQGANLQGANLHKANLQGANLHGANLRGTKLCGVNLSDAILSGVTWEGADLREADLSAATLEVSTLIPFPATPAQNVSPHRPLASSTPVLVSRAEGTAGIATPTKADMPKMSREQLTMAYYVKGKPPKLQPPETKDDMPVALAKMEEDNRAKRELRINKENICERPLPAVVKADTNLMDQWVARARAQFDRPDGVAKDMLDAAVKLEQNHFGAAFQLGRWWYLQASKAKENGKGEAARQELLRGAIEQYEQAIRIAKNAKADGTPWKELEADAHYNLGSAYVLKEEYDKAIEHLTRWQELSNIADDRVLTNLGISYLYNKVKPEKERARALFKQAADMNPTNDVAKKELRQLK